MTKTYRVVVEYPKNKIPVFNRMMETHSDLDRQEALEIAEIYKANPFKPKISIQEQVKK